MKVLIIRHAQSQNNIVQAQVMAYLDFNPHFESGSQSAAR